MKGIRENILSYLIITVVFLGVLFLLFQAGSWEYLLTIFLGLASSLAALWLIATVVDFTIKVSKFNFKRGLRVMLGNNNLTIAYGILLELEQNFFHKHERKMSRVSYIIDLTEVQIWKQRKTLDHPKKSVYRITLNICKWQLYLISGEPKLHKTERDKLICISKFLITELFSSGVIAEKERNEFFTRYNDLTGNIPA
ncbi:MAG TPA: hypothetical protein VIT44_01575 [Cyclobacteriaceae bacterium]